MDQYEYNRTAHRVYGKIISELARRQTGHSRSTIKKALRGEPWGYKEREHQLFPLLGPFRPIIVEWLKNDKDQPKKQRHTARRIYNRLRVEHGYQGSESNVRRYVRMVQLDLGVDLAGKVFIPCDPEAGQEAEVHWGSATAILGGETVRLKFFCRRSKFSGKHFVRFYRAPAGIFDAHLQAFEFFGGVFPVLIYDSLTTAVSKVLQGKRRLEQESFSRFKAYYSFPACFCTSASGNEKDGVEGLVGFARRNYMVPVPEAESLEAHDEKMLGHCLAYGSHKMAGRSESVAELFEKGKDHLLAAPKVVYNNIQSREARVDKYATVMVDKNRYSVPWRQAGRRVKILRHVDRVEIFSGTTRLAVHERLFANNKWSLTLGHYLELIEPRPMSCTSARPIRQWQEHWPESLHHLLAGFCRLQGDTKGIKEFIAVLMPYSHHPAEEVAAEANLPWKKVLAERHEKGSVIITTSLGFADWTQVFGDPVMTAALLDSLTH